MVGVKNDESQEQGGSDSRQIIHPDDLKALHELMEADPYIRKRLCGSVSLPFPDSQSQACETLTVEDQMQNGEKADESLEWSKSKKWNPVAVQFHKESGHVRLLDISGHRIKYLPFEPFSMFTGLKTLNLGGTDVPIAQMIEAIGNCSATLENLHLGGNGLRDVGMVTLVQEVLASKAPTLKKLDVRYNDIGPVGMLALSKIMTDEERRCKIEFLYMEGNILGDKGAKDLALSLQQDSCCLQEIFLGNNDIGAEGATALANAIEGNRSLTKLYLEGNHIGEEGGKAFSTSLENMDGTSCLKKLFVDNNGIGKEVSMRLARALNSDSIIGGL